MSEEEKRLIRNAAKCRHCGTIIESKHRHDFVTHHCTRPDGVKTWFAVDGGFAYLKRVGDRIDWEEASTWSEA
jgi:hypothetical protein